MPPARPCHQGDCGTGCRQGARTSRVRTRGLEADWLPAHVPSRDVPVVGLDGAERRQIGEASPSPPETRTGTDSGAASRRRGALSWSSSGSDSSVHRAVSRYGFRDPRTPPRGGLGCSGSTLPPGTFETPASSSRPRPSFRVRPSRPCRGRNRGASHGVSSPSALAIAGAHRSRVCLARFVAPPGFGPLLAPCFSCDLHGLVSCRARSWGSALRSFPLRGEGSHLSVRSCPPAVGSNGRTLPRPTSLGSWALLPPEVRGSTPRWSPWPARGSPGLPPPQGFLPRRDGLRLPGGLLPRTCNRRLSRPPSLGVSIASGPVRLCRDHRPSRGLRTSCRLPRFGAKRSWLMVSPRTRLRLAAPLAFDSDRRRRSCRSSRDTAVGAEVLARPAARLYDRGRGAHNPRDEPARRFFRRAARRRGQASRYQRFRPARLWKTRCTTLGTAVHKSPAVRGRSKRVRRAPSARP